jgi:hypothetical protein
VHCRRPVFLEATRQLPKLIVCGSECRTVAKGARARARNKLRQPEAKPSTCEACGAQFMPKRSDTRYCSKACKQLGYRGRVRERTERGHGDTRGPGQVC